MFVVCNLVDLSLEFCDLMDGYLEVDRSQSLNLDFSGLSLRSSGARRVRESGGWGSGESCSSDESASPPSLLFRFLPSLLMRVCSPPEIKSSRFAPTHRIATPAIIIMVE